MGREEERRKKEINCEENIYKHMKINKTCNKKYCKDVYRKGVLGARQG